MTSTTITAYAQGDVEEAIAGLINPNITTIYNAKRIITMDDRNVSATAVAVTGDRIVAVGSLDSVKKALGTTPYSVDNTFGKRYIMPGLIDQHLHPILGALTLSVPVIAPEAWVLPGRPGQPPPLTRNTWQPCAALKRRCRIQTSRYLPRVITRSFTVSCAVKTSIPSA